VSERPPRHDPAGKRALFESKVVAPPEQLRAGRVRDGRDSLFSAGPAGPGTVVVSCSTCLVRSRIPLGDLGLRLLTGAFVVPGRRKGYWLRCPACDHRTWCSVQFRDP
jgi:hypothetical protein